MTPGCVGPRNWLHWAMQLRARLHLSSCEHGLTTMLSRSTCPTSSSGLRGERLPVEVVPERLHAGEAVAARRGVRLVAARAGRWRGARSSGSTARLRSSIVWRNWRSGLAKPGRVLGEPAQLVRPPPSSPGRRAARRPTASPSAWKRGRARLARTGRSRVRKVSSSPEARLEVPQDRRLRLGQVAQAVHVWPDSARKAEGDDEGPAELGAP